MKDYERLTERRHNNVIHNCGKCPKVNEPNFCSSENCAMVILNRLCELEDKIESGKLVELPLKPNDEVFIVNNTRHWANIDTILIYNESNGKQTILYTWVQYDRGVDITELWDDGEFDISEIGNSILIESLHDEQIKNIIAKENARYAAEAELAELKNAD